MSVTVKLFGPGHTFLAEQPLRAFDEPVVFTGLGPCEVVSAEIVDPFGQALPLDIRSLPRVVNLGDTLTISQPTFMFGST